MGPSGVQADYIFGQFVYGVVQSNDGLRQISGDLGDYSITAGDGYAWIDVGINEAGFEELGIPPYPWPNFTIASFSFTSSILLHTGMDDFPNLDVDAFVTGPTSDAYYNVNISRPWSRIYTGSVIKNPNIASANQFYIFSDFSNLYFFNMPVMPLVMGPIYGHIAMGFVRYPDDYGQYYYGYLTDYAPVPESSTMLLLASGLVGLIGFRRN